MEGAYTVHSGYSVASRLTCCPTLGELAKLITKNDKKCNISIYDSEADEYYPVEVILRATNNDVLDEDHLILAIKIPPVG
jgi:hypothetical protein